MGKKKRSSIMKGTKKQSNNISDNGFSSFCGETDYQCDKIVDMKIMGGHRYYLVQWKGYDQSYNTWQPVANLLNVSQSLVEFQEEKKEYVEKILLEWNDRVFKGIEKQTVDLQEFEMILVNAKENNNQCKKYIELENRLTKEGQIANQQVAQKKKRGKPSKAEAKRGHQVIKNEQDIKQQIKKQECLHIKLKKLKQNDNLFVIPQMEESCSQSMINQALVRKQNQIEVREDVLEGIKRDLDMFLDSNELNIYHQDQNIQNIEFQKRVCNSKKLINDPSIEAKDKSAQKIHQNISQNEFKDTNIQKEMNEDFSKNQQRQSIKKTVQMMISTDSSVSCREVSELSFNGEVENRTNDVPKEFHRNADFKDTLLTRNKNKQLRIGKQVAVKKKIISKSESIVSAQQKRKRMIKRNEEQGQGKDRRVRESRLKLSQLLKNYISAVQLEGGRKMMVKMIQSDFKMEDSLIFKVYVDIQGKEVTRYINYELMREHYSKELLRYLEENGRIKFE